MEKLFSGKTVLVTGGVGSVGSELVKEVLKHGPAAVRILDIDETRQFELKQELKQFKNVRFFIGDVRDRARMRYAVEGVDIIYHAAALKHVEACEYNPFEAVKTNVIGTQNLIDVALEAEVGKVIFTSSDKAVNTTNVMGSTKHLCERLITAANYYRGKRKTVFASVRFGNVVGSRGSVVPLFRDQIRAGGPLTVTNSEMTRFMISMRRALELLFKATQLSQCGEVFVFKMPSVKVSDLAETMTENLAPKFGHDARNIKIEIIGTKPGEKMHEELMTEEEAHRALELEDMFIILPEMKELFTWATTTYPNAKPAKLKTYKSNDEKPMGKGEITKMLAGMNLLDA